MSKVKNVWAEAALSVEIELAQGSVSFLFWNMRNPGEPSD